MMSQRTAVPRIVDAVKVQQFVDKVQSLRSDDVAVIIHDSDADGITSGLLVRAMLMDRGIRVEDMISHVNRAFMLQPAHIERIVACKPTIIFSTDLDLATLQGFSELYERVSVPLVIQDHHTVNPWYATQQDRIVYVNPIEMTDTHEGAQYCSAKFMYDLCSQLQDMSAYRYLAAIGILGDNNAKTWHDFLVAFVAQEGLAIDVQEPQGWYQTQLSKPMGLIFCSTAIDQEAFTNVLKIFSEARNFADLLEAAKHNPYDYVQKELNSYIQRYPEYVTHYPEHNLHVFHVDSPYHIASVLTTILSQKELDAVWLSAHPQGDFMRMSARNQSSRYHLGNMMRQLCGQFPDGNGGGHIPAAAGRVRLADFDAFLTRFIQSLPEFER